MSTQDYLNRVLDLTYQGGQLGLGALGLVLVAANPSWLRSRHIYAALCSIFFATCLSAGMAVWRNFFEGNSLSACKAAVYTDLTAYWFQMTLIILLMMHRLIILLPRKLVYFVMATFGIVATATHAVLLRYAEPRLDTKTVLLCKTGVPNWLYSVSDGVRMVIELVVLLLFVARIAALAMTAKKLGGTIGGTFYSAIVTKGIFRVIIVFMLDIVMLALNNVGEVAQNAQKSARLAANAFKLALFLSDYLDYRFIMQQEKSNGTGSSFQSSTLGRSGPQSPTTLGSPPPISP